jgi:hypothetical protein
MVILVFNCLFLYVHSFNLAHEQLYEKNTLYCGSRIIYGIIAIIVVQKTSLEANENLKP